MRSLEEYRRLPWTIVVRFHDEQGGYWSARVAELPGCMVALADRSALLAELDLVVELTLETMLRDGEQIPEPAAAPV